MSVGIICASISAFFVSAAVLICIGVLLLITFRLRPMSSKVSVLLVINTVLSMCFTNAMMLMLFIYNIYGELNPSVSFDDPWCSIRAYLAYTSYCDFYYSCLLQATFRLFRVVFYKRKGLQSRQFFLLAIASQWSFTFALTLPNLLPKDYQYIPTKYKCWLSFANIRGLCFAFLLIYILPLAMISAIYVYIIRFIRQTADGRHRRRQSNARDLLILKRILILLFVTLAVGIPTLVILFISIIGSIVIPHAYDIQDISLAAGLFAAVACFTMITPEVQKIFTGNQRQIRPTIMAGNNQDHRTQTIQQQLEE